MDHSILSIAVSQSGFSGIGGVEEIPEDKYLLRNFRVLLTTMYVSSLMHNTSKVSKDIYERVSSCFRRMSGLGNFILRIISEYLSKVKALELIDYSMPRFDESRGLPTHVILPCI